MTGFFLLFVVVFLTLGIEFSNGWHDAANSIATVVSTRVLKPFTAVAWAAFWNFIAAFFFGTAVAGTIGKGLVQIELINQQVILARRHRLARRRHLDRPQPAPIENRPLVPQIAAFFRRSFQPGPRHQ